MLESLENTRFLEKGGVHEKIFGIAKKVLLGKRELFGKRLEMEVIIKAFWGI